MTLSNTPHTEALKDLKASLEKLSKLQKAQFVELEILKAKHSQEWDNLLNGGEVNVCETCDKIFVRTQEDIKHFEFQCLDCRPAPKCDECDAELSGKEENMCHDCEFAFHL